MKHVLSVALLLAFFIARAQNAEYYFEKAKEKEQQKDFQYASVLIDKAIQQNGTNAWYYLKKAEIQLELPRPHDAIRYIKKAILLDTTLAEAYNRAGGFYNSRGYKDSSMVMYDQAIKLAKNDTARHAYLLNRGALKIIFMDYKGSLADFEEVLRFDPDNLACLNNIANTYKELGRTDQAISTMKKAIALDKNSIGPYINLGLLYAEIDSLDNSILYFNKAIAIEPEQALIYSNRGFTYYKLKRYNDAVRDINKSLSLYPTNAFAYKNLALVYFAIDKMEEGCTALKYAEHYGFEKRYGQEVNDLKKKHCKH